jgi:hypothetical protein
VHRKDSTKPVPAGIDAVKLDLSNKEELVSVFKGQDVVIRFDACIAASVKRVTPSEYSTNLESPLAINLPITRDKVEIRRYIMSVITTTPSATTWTSINNGPFFDTAIKFGALGPNAAAKKVVFHNGGNNEIDTSTLSDIATAVVRVLDPVHFSDTANQPIYIHSAAVTERYLTSLISKITGFDFRTVENGQIVDIDVEKMTSEADEKLRKGDQSAMFSYYFQMMYGKGYGGSDFKRLSLHGRLSSREMIEKELEDKIREFFISPTMYFPDCHRV